MVVAGMGLERMIFFFKAGLFLHPQWSAFILTSELTAADRRPARSSYLSHFFSNQRALECDSVSPVIELHQLAKRYGRIDALRSVTLSVGAGEIFGLLGPNGAGKTTLIRLLTGSTRPSAGDVKVLGLDPVRDSQSVRRQIGYMPQAPALYEDLSPRDNIRFFSRAHKLENLEQRIDQVLDLSNLRSRERDPVYTFSGGMKQRVSLACALVHRPARADAR